MAIYSACSNLETRELMWVARPAAGGDQYTFAGQINPVEGWWVAGVSADRYASEVRPIQWG